MIRVNLSKVTKGKTTLKSLAAKCMEINQMIDEGCYI